jgi:hypothetical protein
MGMFTKRMLALRDDRVLLCYGWQGGGACRLAEKYLSEKVPTSTEESLVEKSGAETVLTTTEESLGEKSAIEKSSLDVEVNATEIRSQSNLDLDGKLPPIPWGNEHAFCNSSVRKIEVERLADDRFVVCFEGSSDAAAQQDAVNKHVLACSLGAIVDDGELLPFTNATSLELGNARLVSIAVAAAGRRFAVCFVPRKAVSSRAQASNPSARKTSNQSAGKISNQSAGKLSNQSAGKKSNQSAAKASNQSGAKTKAAAGKATATRKYTSTKGYIPTGDMLCRWAQLTGGNRGGSIKWVKEPSPLVLSDL